MKTTVVPPETPSIATPNPEKSSEAAIRLRERLDHFLREEIDLGSFPGASYVVGTSADVVVENALGHSVVVPAKIQASPSTIYDVASLTKPLITATLVLRACLEGRIDLDEPLSNHLEELRGSGKEHITFIDLLTHRGGFQAWYPLYAEGGGGVSYLQSIVRRPLRYEPGTREIYSCLGFILLHLALGRVYGEPVEAIARSRIFEPLGLTTPVFSPPPELKYLIAATEWGNTNERRMVDERSLKFDGFRNYMIWGEVNDGNAWFMGGMAGNAGLFATARDVYAIARSYTDGNETILSSELLDRSLRNYTIGLEENRALGWQLQSERADHPSAPFSERSFGHTGFTGTSAWVDPERDLVVVLLTNRLHPTVRPLNMQAVRSRFHRLVVEQWDRSREAEG